MDKSSEKKHKTKQKLKWKSNKHVMVDKSNSKQKVPGQTPNLQMDGFCEVFGQVLKPNLVHVEV